MLDNIRVRDNFDGFIDITGKKCTDNGYSRETLAKAVHINPSMIRYYNEWYSLDDGLYYFKDFHMYNELFLSELARELGVRCVEFFLAKNDNHIGVVSKNFKKTGNKYYNYLEFADTFFERRPYSMGLFIGKVKRKFNEEEANNIIKDICYMMAFDFFTFQKDRMNHNICFETENGITRLAPLFDNGSVDIRRPFDYYSCIDDLRFSSETNLSEHNEYTLELIRKYRGFYDGLVQTLDINVEDVLNRTIEKYGLDIPDTIRENLLGSFDNKKQIIENSLTLSLKR